MSIFGEGAGKKPEKRHAYHDFSNKRSYAPYLESLIRPEIYKIRDAINYDQPYDLDLSVDEEDIKGAGYGLLGHFLDEGITNISDGKFGFTGRGFDYTPDKDKKLYFEGRPGGFEIGGNIRF